MLGRYQADVPTHESFLDPPSRDSYDVLIIGAGGGGYHGGFRLSSSGKTALIVDDKGNLGGNCLYEGCVPSKAVYMTAYTAEKLAAMVRDNPSSEEAARLIRATWEDAIAHKDWVQGVRYQQHIREVLEHGKLEMARGIAEPRDSTRATVRAVDGSWEKEVSFKSMIVATGSVPVTPPIKGSELTVGSEQLFGFKTPYRFHGKDVGIIGGGYIGVELASALSRFGYRATIIEMLPNIMSGWDDEAVSFVRGMLESRGVRVFTGSKVKAIRGSGTKEVVFERNGKTESESFDDVVMVVGRKPFVDPVAGLGIANNGRVEVSTAMRTSLPNVYAAGDVIGRYMLFHAAVKGSTIAALNIIYGNPAFEMNFNAVPLAVFTEPEVALVGVSPGQAKRLGIPHTVVSYNLEEDAYAQIMKVREGRVNIVVEQGTQRVIGGLIYGEAASLLINEIALAVATSTRVYDIAVLAHQHPTIFESVDRAAINYML